MPGIGLRSTGVRSNGRQRDVGRVDRLWSSDEARSESFGRSKLSPCRGWGVPARWRCHSIPYEMPPHTVRINRLTKLPARFGQFLERYPPVKEPGRYIDRKST